jgi:GTP-binding protein Era
MYDESAAFDGEVPELPEFEVTPPGHRSGYVAVVGRPNVGKSTLINRLLGQKVAIVSPKPQTTRNRLLGVLTREDAQVIFLDTPGVHQPKHRLGEAMVETAASALPDADVVLWVVDGSVPPTDDDRQVAAMLERLHPKIPRVLVLNKSDKGIAKETPEAYAELAPTATKVQVSASRAHNLERMVEEVVMALPEGPRYYPADQVTDQQVRFMAGELVREQLLLQLGDEVPHSVAVLVNEFKERSPEMTYISAVIYVERESQKPIVLGKDGQKVKRVGQAARESIEALLGTRVYLELWVKVRPKWRSNDEELRRLGYPPPKRATKGG